MTSIKTICFAMDYHHTERMGGAEVQAWLLAKELARRGYIVNYICHSISGNSGQTQFVDGVTIHWLRFYNHFKWMTTSQYYSTLRRLRPDIIIQRYTSFTTGILGIYARLNNIQFAWICCDNAIPFKWFFLKNQIVANSRLHVSYIKGLVFLFNAMIYDISRHIGMRYATTYFTQNQEQYNNVYLNFKKRSFRIISGHDLSVIPIKDVCNTQRNKIVLWVGNLGKNKRPEKFIELANMNENSDLKFVMIGRLVENNKKELFTNAPQNFNWLGELPFDEANKWFTEAIAFVHTSNELYVGFPNTFIQAWLNGVPVITLHVNPNKVITRYDLGCVCKTVEEMSDALNSLLADRDEYYKRSKRIATYARENHSIEKAVDSLLNNLNCM